MPTETQMQDGLRDLYAGSEPVSYAFHCSSGAWYYAGGHRGYGVRVEVAEMCCPNVGETYRIRLNWETGYAPCVTRVTKDNQNGDGQYIYVQPLDSDAVIKSELLAHPSVIPERCFLGRERTAELLVLLLRKSRAMSELASGDTSTGQPASWRIAFFHAPQRDLKQRQDENQETEEKNQNQDED